MIWFGAFYKAQTTKNNSPDRVPALALAGPRGLESAAVTQLGASYGISTQVHHVSISFWPATTGLQLKQVLSTWGPVKEQFKSDPAVSAEAMLSHLRLFHLGHELQDTTVGYFCFCE